MQIQLDNKKKLVLLIIFIIVIIIAFIIYTLITNAYEEIPMEEMISESLVLNEEDFTENNSNEYDKQGSNLEIKDEENLEKIIVHIVGEVKKEGIVYLNKGSRIIDAIKEAGGETKEADLSKINLAYELQDGQKVYIPNKKEEITEYITMSSGDNLLIEGNNTSNTNERKEIKVNINTANQDELDTLPGIGPSIAQRIIEYREENGNFTKIEDLQNVKGIGDAKYEEIKDNVTV